MRTTLTFDDELFAKAQFYTGIQERGTLINEALRALVQREAARRLAKLGGSQPDIEMPPRKRPAVYPLVDQADT